MMSTRPRSYGALRDGDDDRRGQNEESAGHPGSWEGTEKHKDVECLKRVLSTQECAEQSGGIEGPEICQGAIRAPKSEKGKEGIEQLEEW